MSAILRFDEMDDKHFKPRVMMYNILILNRQSTGLPRDGAFYAVAHAQLALAGNGQLEHLACCDL